MDDLAQQIGNNQATVLNNMYKYRRKLVRRKGTSGLGSGALAPDQDHDGLEWTKFSNTEYLVAAHNGSLVDWFHATPGTALTNGSGKFTSGNDVNFAWVGGKLYAGNGVNANVRFNGTRVDQVSYAAPGSAPTVATGAAGVLTGAYTYKVTFTGADGQESEASSASATVNPASQRVDLSAIPTSAEPDAAGRKIYRTKAGGSTYFLVTTIADNVTTTYTDNTADASITVELTTGGTAFPPVRYLVEHQGRLVGMWSAAATGDKQTIYIGHLGTPAISEAAPDFTEEGYDPNQGTRATLQGRAAAEGTGLASHSGVLVAFTGATMFLLHGDQPANFRVQEYAPVGCVAHRTIAKAKNLLIWLAPTGVYAWDGTSVRRISDDQRTTLEAITAADQAKAHAYVLNDRYTLCWPSGAIYYDLEYNVWGTLDPWTWRDSTVTVHTSSALQRVYAPKYGQARVYQLETGATDAHNAGASIAAVWESRDFDMGLLGREKRIHFVQTYWKKGTGTASVVLKSGSGQTLQTISHDISSVDNASETISRQFTSAVEQARSEFLRLRVECTTSAAELELLGAGFLWSTAT